MPGKAQKRKFFLSWCFPNILLEHGGNTKGSQSGFGGADIVCWPLIPKFVGTNPAQAIGFLKGDKNPQHAFLRKGSKIIGPMSQI